MSLAMPPSPRWLRSLAPAIAIAAIVLALAATACSSGSGDTADDPALPDVELDALDGGTYAIAEGDQPRALNLWATWCAPCRAELPAFDAVADRVADQGLDVEIVGINVGDTGDDAAELVAELGLDFPQVLDPRAQVQRGLRITGLPATIFVDADGTVVDVHNGELTEQELADLLDELFGLTLGAQ